MTDITVRFNLSFNRRFITAAGAFVIMLCAVPELDSESVTLSTYYPAPSGVYTNMITTNNTFLARDGGALAVGTVSVVGGSKLTVAGGSIAGTYGLTPSYVAWNTYGTGAGGAAIYNDSGAYQGLMLVGNNSGGGGVRRVKVWDEMTVNGNTITTGNATIGGSVTANTGNFSQAIVNTTYNCITQVYGLGVQNCPAGRFATYTSGVMVKYTMTVGTTDPSGTMLCCTCSGGCPSL